ncbi:MAG: hypothetical protein M1831_002132 [Alyxoria varia]|nr:MAG: hypothetical protein M1831_002132 [Alyxoria varia]
MAESTTSLETASHSPLVSSISSLSSQPTSQPNVSRTYKHANQLFLTRQIYEALQCLETVILEPKSNRTTNHSSESPSTTDTDDSTAQSSRAPVATAARAARVRTWTLYLAILNEVMEMGPEAGKELFGAVRYKELVGKTRDGSIWEEVVTNGYAGAEAVVDAEVVANLATLMLAHAPSQKLTQLRLETYLSSMNTPNPGIAPRLERPPHDNQKHTNGTSTPQDLDSRLKILEIYTLHVLPRNQDYAYAREFINMNEVLNEERKEAFIQALQSVQDEREFNSKKEAELQRQREQQVEDTRNRDHGTQKAQQARSKPQAVNHEEPFVSKAESEKWTKDNLKSEVPKKQITKPSTNAHAVSKTFPQTGPAKRSAGANPDQGQSNRNGARRPPARLSKRFALLFGVVQKGIMSMAQSLRAHPLKLIRMLALLIAFLMALSRRDLRDRLLEAQNKSWTKLKQTVGMGTKVSYI